MSKLTLALRWSAVACCALAGTAFAAQWNTAGRDLENSRFQKEESRISAKTVGRLKLKWEVDTAGDVTANPALDETAAYFPDSAGWLYKVRRSDGALLWKRPISDYTGIAGDFARATPAIADGALILGNQSGKFLRAFGSPSDPQPAQVFAVDKETGEKLWSTQVDDTALSFVTHSAIVVKQTVIVGVASNEELVAAFVPPQNWIWQFRGSVVALDVRTGAIRWKTYMVPPEYYGGAVWGSTGAVDLKLNLVYMATGNNYAIPKMVRNCLLSGRPASRCMSPDNHFDSIVAMDLDTGAVKWAGRGLEEDAWNVACGLMTPGFSVLPGPFFPGVYGNCAFPDNPGRAGPDHDFAQGPMLFGNGLVGAGQKSGKFWTFRASDGKLAWSKQVAPPGVTGGLQWGSATDGNRIYVAAANSGPSTAGGGTGAMPWTLKDGSTTTAGGWAALDAKSGEVLWTTKDPRGSRAEAAVSGANGVIFGCNLEPGMGTMYALDAATGQKLWSFDSGNSCNAGPSIADGMVFWGSGTFVSPGGPKKVFAFGL